MSGLSNTQYFSKKQTGDSGKRGTQGNRLQRHGRKGYNPVNQIVGYMAGKYHLKALREPEV